MGLDKCYMCNELAGWFIWSSSRHFPRQRIFKVMNLVSKGDKNKIYDGQRICQKCFNKLKGK